MLKPGLVLVFAFFGLTATASAGCPVLNGKFVKPSSVDKSLNRVARFATRVEGGQFSYLLGTARDFQVADGNAYPYTNEQGEKMNIRLVCQGNSLLQEVQAVGSNKVWFRRLTLLSSYELDVESNFPDQAGLYTKEF